ncbi:putative membrane protein [Streptomyces sp. B4I13]|nr:putative membrane protein [Streptomyces sp. B4I13]
MRGDGPASVVGAEGVGLTVALAVTVFGADDPETGTGEWAALSGFLWGVTALAVWPAVRILRRTRRR